MSHDQSNKEHQAGEGWRQRLDREHPVVTVGHHHYRRERYLTAFIESELSQALKAREQEILREVTELQEKEIELYGTDKHGLSVEQLIAIINKHGEETR